MARINVEDSIESTNEWRRLLRCLQGDEERAMGMLVFFWRHAQRLCGQNKLVTQEEMDERGWGPLIMSGWAIARDGGFYALGSRERFAWYEQRVRAGRARSAGQRDTNGRYVSLDKDASDDPAADQRVPASHQPPAPSPSLSLILNTAHRGSKDLINAAYKLYPRKEGKARGFKRLEKEIKTEQDLGALLAAIEKYKKSETVKKGFVMFFSTFAGEWRDWLDPDAGQVNGRTPPPLKQLADLELEEHPDAP